MKPNQAFHIDTVRISSNAMERYLNFILLHYLQIFMIARLVINFCFVIAIFTFRGKNFLST